MMAGMHNIRQRILSGETVTGCWLNLASSLTAEMVGMAGFDWVLIDLEHGPGTEREALYQLQALAHTPAAAIVRVESNDRPRAHRVLDMGAHGIMFPRIDTPEAAAKAIAALRFPPQGVRGVAVMNRACEFGATFRQYLDGANQALAGIIQIETEEAVSHTEEIAAMDGADVLFIGPSDLSHSMGIFGQFDNPRFTAAIDTTLAAAKKHGKAAGILVQKPEDFARYHAKGFTFIACGSDGALLNNAARGLAQTLRAIAAKASGTGA